MSQQHPLVCAQIASNLLATLARNLTCTASTALLAARSCLSWPAIERISCVNLAFSARSSSAEVRSIWRLARDGDGHAGQHGADRDRIGRNGVGTYVSSRRATWSSRAASSADGASAGAATVCSRGVDCGLSAWVIAGSAASISVRSRSDRSSRAVSRSSRTAIVPRCLWRPARVGGDARIDASEQAVSGRAGVDLGSGTVRLGREGSSVAPAWVITSTARDVSTSPAHDVSTCSAWRSADHRITSPDPAPSPSGVCGSTD